MKVIFLGTPKFATHFLKGLIDSKFRPCLVISQPDSVKGRNKKISIPTPVKEVSLQNNIEIWQPENINAAETVAKIKELEPDIIVVMAFGQIICSDILVIPKYGCINIHPSLLPKYRGPSPIQAAILAGDQETGVTIMQMDAKMDHGPILAQKKITIDAKETNETLENKVSMIGTKLLLDTLDDVINNNTTALIQDDRQATYCKLLKTIDGKIDLTKTSIELDRQIRALSSWPSCWLEYQGKRIKIIEAEISPESEKNNADIFYKNENDLLLATSDGALRILKIQPEGKKVMTGQEFSRGYLK